MTRVTIDNELKQKLLNSDGIVELYDESGNLVGRAAPNQNEGIVWDEVFPELTDEEVQKRLNSSEPGLTTEEVKEFLRNRM